MEKSSREMGERAAAKEWPNTTSYSASDIRSINRCELQSHAEFKNAYENHTQLIHNLTQRHTWVLATLCITWKCYLCCLPKQVNKDRYLSMQSTHAVWEVQQVTAFWKWSCTPILNNKVLSGSFLQRNKCKSENLSFKKYCAQKPWESGTIRPSSGLNSVRLMY